jgi:hypothetical protein
MAAGISLTWCPTILAPQTTKTDRPRLSICIEPGLIPVLLKFRWSQGYATYVVVYGH